MYLFLEKEKEGEREGEKYQCVVASHMAPTGDLAGNPGVCPDWELTLWFAAQAQSTELRQPGPNVALLYYWISHFL